jgi:autotransporter-associated beta strand protein
MGFSNERQESPYDLFNLIGLPFRHTYFGEILMNRGFVLFSYGLLVLLAYAIPAQAATVWWNATSGDYSNPLNWNTGTFPAVGDTAVIANGGTATLDAVVPPNEVQFLLIGAAPNSSGFPGDGFTTGTGNFIQNGQTLEVTEQVFITYGSASTGPSYYTMNGGTLNIASSATVNGYLRLGQIYDTSAVMTIGGNSVVNVNGAGTGIVRLGEDIASVGVIKQSGNSTVTLKSGLWMGYFQATASGYYYLSGGTLASNSFGSEQNIGYEGVGVFEQSGGSAYVATRTWIGNTGHAIGVVNLSGGNYHNNGSSARNVVGGSGMGIINLSGTGVYSVNSDIWLGWQPGSTGVVNLGAIGTGGGTLYATGMLRHASAVSQLNFHGGTLKAKIDNTSFLNSSRFGAAASTVDAYVYAEGGIIDTDGKIIFLAALKSPTGLGVGSITVGGNINNYVEAPAVQITGGGGSGATAVATIDANGTITGITITNPGVGYTSAPTVTLRGGKRYQWEWATATATLDSGNASGGITKIGDGILGLIGVNTYTGDTVVQGGYLALIEAGQINPASHIVNNANFVVYDVDGFDITPHTVGVISGTGYTSVYDGMTLTATSITQDGLTIGGYPPLPLAATAAVPEPSAMLLLAFAGLGLLAAALRRR